MMNTIASTWRENMLTVSTLSEKCYLLGTDNARGQIFERVFAPNRDQ